MAPLVDWSGVGRKNVHLGEKQLPYPEWRQNRGAPGRLTSAAAEDFTAWCDGWLLARFFSRIGEGS